MSHTSCTTERVNRKTTQQCAYTTFQPHDCVEKRFKLLPLMNVVTKEMTELTGRVFSFSNLDYVTKWQDCMARCGNRNRREQEKE